MKQSLQNYIHQSYVPYLKEVRTKEQNLKKDMFIINFILSFTEIVKKNMSTINENDIEVLLAKIKIERNLSKQRINRYRSMLLAIFNHAIKSRIILFNPITNVKRHKEFPRNRVLSLDEIQRLLLACKKSKSKELYTVVILTINTGMRHGEILSLRKSDISGNTVTLRAETTKSGNKRTAYLNSTAQKIIKDYMGKNKREDRIFDSACIRKSFATAKCKAQIEGDFRFHDLRRTFATYLMLNDTNVRIIQTLLGHSSLRMTETYLGSNSEKTFNEVEKIRFDIKE